MNIENRRWPIVQRDKQISTTGKISSSVLFACSVPLLCCLFIVVSVQPSIRRPNPITWGITQAMYLSGSAFTIFLSISAYKNKEKWLKGVRNEIVSQTPRLVFFWLFGFLCIIFAALNMSINIDCMTRDGNEPFSGEEILSTMSHMIEIIFYTSQLGFVTYFVNFKFHSSVVLNFGMCTILITHSIVWWFQCVMSSLFKHHILEIHMNRTLLNNTDCYWTSDINKLRGSLEPYFSPARTEYCLLATAFLLRMWHGSDDSKNNPRTNENNTDQRELNEHTSLIQADDTTMSGIGYDGKLPANVAVATARNMSSSAVKDTDRNLNGDINMSRNNNRRKPLSFYGTLLISIIAFTPTVVIIMILISVWKIDFRRLLILEVMHVYNRSWHTLCLIFLYIGLRKQCFVSTNVHQLSGKGRILILSAAGTVAYETFSFLAGAMSNQQNTYLQTANGILAFKSALGIIEVYFQTVAIIYSANCIKKTTHNPSCFCRVEHTFLILLITNGAEWFFNSFFGSGIQGKDIQAYFYQEVYWSVINEILFPFLIFYRFHSFMDMYERYQQFCH